MADEEKPDPKTDDVQPDDGKGEGDNKPSDEEKPEDQKPKEDPKPEDQKPEDDGKPADEPEVPEKYELKVPEKSPLTDEYVQKFESYAKENKLTKEQAQSQLDREHSAAQAGVDNLKAGVEAQSQEWLKQAKADKDIGGDKFTEHVELANSALETLFPESVDIRKVLDSSGLGNNPHVIKAFSRVGRMLNDDKIDKTGGGPPPKQKNVLEKMYDHPTSQQN